jgi:endonuclease/exonuclease/phosphatase family metal-dependent hydrolase
VEKVFLILVILCLGTFGAFAQQDDFRVMTFNIRYDNPDDGEYSWKNRKTLVKEVLDLNKPQIIGFQEALKNQVSDLQSILKGYNHSGVGRDDGKDAGEFSVIFYDTLRYTFKEGSTFWLSETPEIPGSVSWNSACTRIVTWVKLIDRTSKMTICVFNTHFDHVSELARVESARLLLKRMKLIAGSNPVILTGDFNATDTTAACKILTDPRSVFPMNDSRTMSGKEASGPSCSYVGFPFHPKDGELIDFIFVSANSGLKVKKTNVITFHRKDKYPSDHLPVMAIFTTH